MSNIIRDAIKESFGLRCAEVVKDCAVCCAWAEYDRITDLESRLEKAEAINANLMGDDESVPRYTTKRLKQEIAKAVEKAEAERDGWKPIETAPKDGSSILCFVPLDTMGVPFNHRVLALRYEARKSKWLTDVYAFVPFEPTHWRPLPSPPTPDGEAA